MVPKNITQAKAWVRNRGAGRPNIAERNRAVQLLGGQRKYDIYVAQVKSEKAGAKLPAKKAKRTGKRGKAVPKKLLISTGEMIPTTKAEAEHWIRNRRQGRPKKEAQAAVIKLFGGRRYYDDFVALVKQQQAGKVPTPAVPVRKRSKRILKRKTVSKDPREEIKGAVIDTMSQGYLILMNESQTKILRNMLPDWRAAQKEAEILLEELLVGTLHYPNTDNKKRGLHVFGPNDYHNVISPTPCATFNATLYPLTGDFSYREPEFWSNNLVNLYKTITDYLNPSVDKLRQVRSENELSPGTPVLLVISNFEGDYYKKYYFDPENTKISDPTSEVQQMEAGLIPEKDLSTRVGKRRARQLLGKDRGRKPLVFDISSEDFLDFES